MLKVSTCCKTSSFFLRPLDINGFLFLFHLQVGDLGLSKVKHQTMVSGGVRGTLPWMAPELLNGSSTLVTEKV